MSRLTKESWRTIAIILATALILETLILGSLLQERERNIHDTNNFYCVTTCRENYNTDRAQYEPTTKDCICLDQDGNELAKTTFRNAK